jgi:hypothetical protein
MMEAEGPLDATGSRSVTVSQLYVNGFQLGLSNADVAIVGMLDNQPAVKINLSYTLAKTLVVKLDQLMKSLEEATGREIMTTDDAGSGLKESAQKK